MNGEIVIRFTNTAALHNITPKIIIHVRCNYLKTQFSFDMLLYLDYDNASICIRIMVINDF